MPIMLVDVVGIPLERLRLKVCVCAVSRRQSSCFKGVLTPFASDQVCRRAFVTLGQRGCMYAACIRLF